MLKANQHHASFADGLFRSLTTKAKASPSFSFKAIGKEYRLTFNGRGVKRSYLIHKNPIRMFSPTLNDWGFYWKISSMEGKQDYLLLDALSYWLQQQSMWRPVARLNGFNNKNLNTGNHE